MPDHGATPKPAPAAELEPAESETPILVEATAPNGVNKDSRPSSSRKRVSLKVASEPEPAAVATNGEHDLSTSEPSEEANS
jgi:hypothetical protein